MKRRAFVAGMAAVIARPHSGAAQRPTKIYRVGILAEGSLVSDITGGTPKASSIRALLDRLRGLGYRYGETFATEVRSAEGRIDRFPALAAAMLQADVDVIVVTSNRAGMAVKQATSEIPIVLAGASDRRKGSPGSGVCARSGPAAACRDNP